MKFKDMWTYGDDHRFYDKIHCLKCGQDITKTMAKTRVDGICYFNCNLCDKYYTAVQYEDLLDSKNKYLKLEEVVYVKKLKRRIKK